jgi:Protein of unknown function (DUF3089)
MRMRLVSNGGAIALVFGLAVTVAACGSGSKSTTAAKKTSGTAAPASSVVAATGTTGAAVASNTVWLCKPGLAKNPCEGDFTTSVVAADGTRTVSQATVAKNPPIDCFYVYPTVSGQPGPNADLTIDPAEIGVARAQAARFSSVCKVYAPMYRQFTLSAINNRGGITAADAAEAYSDVQNAWLDYLAHDNHGRGVVLIGHSQGSGQLEQLIRQQIDPKPAVRKLLVSALLMGGNVMVPIGKDVGGTFMNVPACRRPDQTGCVVAYSSFLDVPPANSMFGRARVPGDEVLCTNPGALAGGTATLIPEFPTGANGAVGSINAAGPADPNPWVSYRDLYTGECQNTGGANVLHVTPTPGPNDQRPVVTESIGPTWGLHLVDVNIDLGNLVDLVRSQTNAYQG